MLLVLFTTKRAFCKVLFFSLQMSMCCLATLCVVIVGSDPLPSFFLRTVSRGRRCHSGKDADKKEREGVWGGGGGTSKPQKSPLRISGND